MKAYQRPCAALREALREGYGRATLRADLMAGLVVGLIALPLSMALAIASGVAPQHGLYTAIVAGVLTAFFGGSRVQVSGPTAAFVAILVPITTRFGLGGLLLATMMAGLLLVLLGLTGMGRLIEFVPYPVTMGFTAGVAVVIGTLQLRDFFGLTVVGMPEHYLERVGMLARAMPTFRAPDLVVGLATLAVLLAWPHVSRKVPGALVGLALAAVGAWVASQFVPGLQIETISSRFGGIPRTPPLPGLPWHLPDAHGQPIGLSLALVRALAPSAFAIAMLGAIESLLSAVVADGMTRKRHDPDAELIAQGTGNLVAAFFGGFAATGALARTAANVRAGARSPVAAMTHSVFVLAAVLLLAPLLGYLPMAALAALLILVAWNMGEWHHFVHMLRVAPRSDVVVLLTCFGLTIVFDMVVSVTVGIMLAALLFMKRMAEVSEVRLVGERHPELDEPLPRGLLLYTIAGPLFFGAAQKAIHGIANEERRGVRVVVLDFRSVPALDATALVGLESMLARLNERGIKVIVAGAQPQPLRALIRAGWRNRKGKLRIFRSFENGVAVGRRHTERMAGTPSGAIAIPRGTLGA